MQEILESCQLVTVLAPVDLAGGANTGDRVSMRNYRRCLFIVAKAAGGTGGDDPVITVQSHTAASGGSSADLATVTRVYSKQAATDLTAVGVFTIVTQSAAATYSNATLAEQACLLGIDVKAEDLPDGSDFVSINIADVGSGNAQLAAVLALLCEPRYGSAVGVSAIA